MKKENTTEARVSLEFRFREHVVKHALWKTTDQLMVACSGGIDSVVLVHLLKKAGYTFSILHCNFNLRGEESQRDEAFVRQLASSVGVDLKVKSFDTSSEMQKLGKGVQETARLLRYTWFDEVIEQNGQTGKKTLLLTAHQADDQAETLAMNFFRGTGIAGLHGISERHGAVVRPLLFARRDEIVEYARVSKILWVEDSSNREENYTRNLFRNIIFPEIQKVFPAAKENLIENAKRFAEIELIYRQRVEELKLKLVQRINGSIGVPINKLKQSPAIDTVIYEVFKDFGFTAAQVPEIRKLFDAISGKFVQSSTHRILRNRDWLLIDLLDKKNNSIIVIEEAIGEVMADGFTLSFVDTGSTGVPDADPEHAYVDFRFIQYPLILRKWKSGDYFYPLGMKKKKKIARFLTDIKLSRVQKENQWVIESNKKILWVIGRRIDDRVKVTLDTKRVMKVSVKAQ
ncbi:MAG: tRNA lysidine(34) synthetase TilS [bacterium]|jgi:tRNA(Ile)-lysidine synthase